MRSSQSDFLTTLASNLDQGINDPGAFVLWLPGWQTLPPDAAQTAAQVSQLTLNTYAGAIAIANAQTANFSNEDAHLAQIEADSSQSTAALQAIQANTEAQLAVAQQIQLMRQLQATQLVMEAVRNGEELNERSQAGATIATSLDLGVLP
jgi:conjugal transfer/entry exclusion protein